MRSDKVKLLMISGAVGREHSGSIFISDEQARKLEALPKRFDTTLVVKRSGPRQDLTCPLPAGIKATWISGYPSKWHLLTLRRFFFLWKDIKRVDVFLTFVPGIDGLSPLILALIARKPRYSMLIASPIHFRHDASGGRLTAALMRMLMNACALISTRVLANGRALADDLFPPLRRKVREVILSSLTEADFISPKEPDAANVELLWVGRLVPSKRVDVVIQATHLLVERGVGARLTVVGDGPLREDLIKQAESLGLKDRVRFPGWIGDREHLRDYYAPATFFLFPTETEGVSLAVQEAMASGTPVISTGVGGLKDFLRDGEDAVVVHGPDPEAFAEAVLRLLKDPYTYMLLAEGAQRKVSALSNETWVREFNDLVLKDLGRA